MIINRDALLATQALIPMYATKVRSHGVTHGMSEAGYDIRIKQEVRLHPFKKFSLASTIEKFEMPDDLIAIVHDKSSWARRGLSVFNTVIESGWVGHLTLELVYHGWRPIVIPAGAGIAQVIFHQIIEPVRYSGRYQNQGDRPVEAIAS